MKELLVFWDHTGKAFDPELAKLQIENCIRVVGHTEDLIFAANFDWEYRGVRTTILKDSACPERPQACKLYAINELFHQFDDDECYWFHDFDVFRVNAFENDVLKEGEILGCTKFHRTPWKWSTGSLFFTTKIRDMLPVWIAHTEGIRDHCEEASLNAISYLPQVVTTLDYSYQYRGRRWTELWPDIEKPLKVVHMIPHRAHFLFYMRWNPTNKSIFPPELDELFRKYYPRMCRGL